MKLSILAGVALAISLAACGSDSVNRPSPGPAPASTCRTTTPAATQALFAAESAYNVPAQAYVTLDRRGQISAELKPQLKASLESANDALRLAREAACVGDSVAVALHSQEAQRLTLAAKRLLPDFR